ncbi:MAG: hypothetical protein ACI9EB_001142 [Pseudomonas sp.]|jgi:hypothetical protein
MPRSNIGFIGLFAASEAARGHRQYSADNQRNGYASG